MVRTIIHIDINSCFAACEQQDNPTFRKKPVAVVQDSGKRSVIIASSTEAKLLGIKTGDTIYDARRRVPQLLVTPARFDRYVHYSRKFRAICSLYSNQIEVFSIDELFIDVTETKHLFGGELSIARELKRRLRSEVGDYLTCSVGIAPNKMLAKLASGSQKPDGLVVVSPENKLAFLDAHSPQHICGIGHRVAAKLTTLGIFSISQMRAAPESLLTRTFGVMGKMYHRWAWGEDDSPVAQLGCVQPDKSFGNQLTLSAAVSLRESLPIILWLSWQVGFRMRSHAVGATVVSLGLRSKASYYSAQKKVSLCFGPLDIYRVALTILSKKLSFQGTVRFLSVSVSGLISCENSSLPLLPEDIKHRKLLTALDSIAAAHHPFYLQPARLLTTGIAKSEFNGFSKKF